MNAKNNLNAIAKNEVIENAIFENTKTIENANYYLICKLIIDNNLNAYCYYNLNNAIIECEKLTIYASTFNSISIRYFIKNANNEKISTQATFKLNLTNATCDKLYEKLNIKVYAHNTNTTQAITTHTRKKAFVKGASIDYLYQLKNKPLYANENDEQLEKDMLSLINVKEKLIALFNRYNFDTSIIENAIATLNEKHAQIIENERKAQHKNAQDIENAIAQDNAINKQIKTLENAIANLEKLGLDTTSLQAQKENAIAQLNAQKNFK